jgi:GDP-4-dehydro-6-deoxy-D-mannose reductase
VARRVLVTGASGFVGRHLLRLLDAEPDVEIHAWTRDEVPAGVRGQWLVLELADRDTVVKAISEVRPDLVFHLAGAAHIGQSFGAVAETLSANARGTASLVDALRDAGLRPRVLVTGSAAVYPAAEHALDERTPPGPASPYGVSKLAQEMVAVRAWHEDGLPTVVVRSFNHVGPGQAPTFFAPSFARQIAEVEAGLRPPVLRVGNLEARRDLTDVRDTVRAYRLLIDAGTPGEAYNMCSGMAHSVGDVLAVLVDLAHVRVRIDVDPSLLRPSDTPVVLGSYARLQAATGWAPLIPLGQSLRDLLDDCRRQVARSAAP